MTKNITITVLLLIIVSFAAYLYGSGNYRYIFNQPSPTPNSQDIPVDQNQPEETGPITTTTPTPTPTPQVSNEDQIKAVMAAKHNKSIAETQIEINEITANHAKGLVKFAGEISGGWFLAVKTTGPWEIVAEGNGTVMCDDIDPYNFPTTMVPECWDEAGQQLIIR